MPFWLSFPCMPVEYRDLDIVELIANKLGIFLKHDLIPFEDSRRTIRVYVLLSLNKPFPNQISLDSIYGTWDQIINIEDAKTVQLHEEKLGHFTHKCGDSGSWDIVVCRDPSSNPHQCILIQKRDEHRSVNHENDCDLSLGEALSCKAPLMHSSTYNLSQYNNNNAICVGNFFD